MAVRIEKKFQVKEAIDQAWTLLRDPRNVAGCIPGAQITEAVDEQTFHGIVSVKVGPALANYKGELHVDRRDDAAHEIEFTGKGLDVKGRGSASMKMTGRLSSLPEGGTEVATVAEVNVVGILAQFGGRMINDVSDVMFKEFVKRFEEKLREDPAAPGTPEAAAPADGIKIVSAAMKGAIRRMVHGMPEESQ